MKAINTVAQTLTQYELLVGVSYCCPVVHVCGLSVTLLSSNVTFKIPPFSKPVLVNKAGSYAVMPSSRDSGKPLGPHQCTTRHEVVMLVTSLLRNSTFKLHSDLLISLRT